MDFKWIGIIFGLICEATGNPCIGCHCMQWTPWLNGDKPGGKGDFESLRFAKNGFGTYITDENGNPGIAAKLLLDKHKITCNHPIEIQCRAAVSHVPYHQTGDYTNYPYYVKCTTDHGFACFNGVQQNGACHDYEIRLLCWRPCHGGLLWTPWTSHNLFPADGDFEGHQLANNPARTYEPCPSGSSPYDIQCRRRSDKLSALLTHQKNLMCDRNWGFVCLNSANPSGCYDYEVRYLCHV